MRVLFTKKFTIMFTNKSKNMKFKVTRRDIVGIGLLVALTIGMYFGMSWGYQGIFFWLFFVSLFYWRVDSRVSIGFALGGLVFIMLLLALSGVGLAPTVEWGGNIITMHLDAFAEKVAVWVYFFLVIGVVKQMYEYKFEKDDEYENGKSYIHESY